MTRKLTLIWSIFMLLLTSGTLISVLFPTEPIPWNNLKVIAITSCILVGYGGSLVGFHHWWDIRPIKKSKMKIKKCSSYVALVEGKDYIILN